MIPSHGLVSPIRIARQNASNSHYDEQICVARRGPSDDARIGAAFSPSPKTPSSCCDPSGTSPPRRAGGSSLNKIRSPPPVLCKIPTLQHAAPAWMKDEAHCLAAATSQKRGAMDPPSSEELATPVVENNKKAPIPAWKQKLLEKRNTKPDMPAWKHKLLEKKRADDATTSNTACDHQNDPPWKRELAARKRERMLKSEELLPTSSPDTSRADRESQQAPQSQSDGFLIHSESADATFDRHNLDCQHESCTSIGMDPPDAVEAMPFAQEENDDNNSDNHHGGIANDSDHDDSDSSSCIPDSTKKSKGSLASWDDSSLEAFLHDTGTIATTVCSPTATTTSISSSASETSSPKLHNENSNPAQPQALSVEDEPSEEPLWDVAKADKEKEYATEPDPITKTDDKDQSDSDDGFDDPSDSDDDDSFDELEWDDNTGAGNNSVSQTMPAYCNDKASKPSTDLASPPPRRPKRRKARRYAAPIFDDYSSDGEEDILPFGVTPAVVPPMEFDDFSKEDFSATTDEETLILADHYHRQRSVVKKATFSDEPMKEDASPLDHKIDGDKKKKKKKKISTKSSICTSKTEKSKKSMKSSRSKKESSTKTRSSKKKSSKNEISLSEDSTKKDGFTLKTKLEGHEKKPKKKSSKSIGGTIKTEKSKKKKKDKDAKKHKDSTKDKHSKKVENLKKDKVSKKTKSASKKHEEKTDKASSKKTDSKHRKSKSKDDEKKTKKGTKEKTAKSKHSRSETMGSF